jgi:hypothetical protein
MIDTYLDTPAAAKALSPDGKLSPRTLEKWRLLGTGPEFMKWGRKVFYSARSLETWAEAQRRQSTSE